MSATGSTTPGTKAGEPTGTPDSIFGKIGKSIERAVEDVINLEVLTGVVAQSPNPVTLSTIMGKTGDIQLSSYAKTKIQLDGDIVEVVPGQGLDAAFRQELLNLHEKNVKVAVQNYNGMMNMIFRVFILAAALANIPVNEKLLLAAMPQITASPKKDDAEE